MHQRNEEQPYPLRSGAGGGHAAPTRDPAGLGGALPGNRWSPLWQSVSRLGGFLPAARAQNADTGALLRGRGDTSGSRRPHGRLVRSIGGAHDPRGPRFNEPIAPGGYSWWYIDAISEDGQHGLTIIAFLGSVFSPYYKRSGRAQPLDHSALNIALYGPNSRWVMTERPQGAVARDNANLAIGPSHIEWTGNALEITIEERDTRLFNPLRRRVSGKVRVIPEALNPQSFGLDEPQNHIWHCMAPRARIEVEMDNPSLSWSGDGYFDHNRGSEPLESGFDTWHWSRAHMKKGAVVCYEGERADGSLFASAIRFDAAGYPDEVDLPPTARLPRSRWQVERRTRSQIGVAQVRRTWEDTPFYARSELSSKLFGESVVAVQESLDMRRFSSPIVQFMLPYRMPRAKA